MAELNHSQAVQLLKSNDLAKDKMHISFDRRATASYIHFYKNDGSYSPYYMWVRELQPQSLITKCLTKINHSTIPSKDKLNRWYKNGNTNAT
jgi:hypothetical protein